MIRVRIDIPCLLAPNTILEKQTYFIGKNIIHKSQTFLDYLLILTNTIINTKCVHAASDFFKTADILERHKQLCTKTDFMLSLHLLSAPDTQWAYIKFSAFKNSTRALFVIYADFESILKPIDNLNKATRLKKKHEICAAAALLFLNN